MLKQLDRLAGRWTTEATHPAMPGVVVRGTTTIEWLEGNRFLIYRARTDHPDFPDALAIIGHMESDRVDKASREVAVAGESPLRMHYFDSRGVFRVYESSIADSSWRIWRDVPGFSQRFTGRLTDGDDTIAGRWELREDDVHWADDVAITYRRLKGMSA